MATKNKLKPEDLAKVGMLMQEILQSAGKNQSLETSVQAVFDAKFSPNAINTLLGSDPAALDAYQQLQRLKPQAK